MTDTPTPEPRVVEAKARVLPAESDLMKEYKSYGPIAKGILWTLTGLTVMYMAAAGCRHIGAGATPSQLERKVQNAQPAGPAPGSYTKSY
jgi:hypothetical protein